MTYSHIITALVSLLVGGYAGAWVVHYCREGEIARLHNRLYEVRVEQIACEQRNSWNCPAKETVTP